MKLAAVVLLVSAAPALSQVYYQPRNPLTGEPGRLLPVQPIYPAPPTYDLRPGILPRYGQPNPQPGILQRPQVRPYQNVNPYQPRPLPF